MAQDIELLGETFEGVTAVTLPNTSGAAVIYRDENDTYALIAPAYSEEETYSEGDYCMYEYMLYKCIQDITSSEEFDPDHWTQVTVVSELQNVTINVHDLGLYQDPDTLIVYPTYRNSVSDNGTAIAGSGGGGSGTNADIHAQNESGWLSKTISANSTCIVAFSWSSIEDGIPTGDGALTIEVNGLIKRTQNVSQGLVQIDISSYLAKGTNKIKVKVSDVYEQTRAITYTVNVVELAITSAFDTSGVFASGTDIEYTYTPTGAVSKTVHFIVDGESAGTSIVTVSGRQQSFMLTGMNHGAHTLLVYFEATIDGETVRSNELYYSLMVVDPTATTPIISTTFRKDTAAQYETLNVPYKVYTPNELTSVVGLLVDGEELMQVTVDRTEQIWSYRPDVVGELTLTIATGNIAKTFSLTITESEIDVEPETEALKLYLTSYGRSNAEAHPEVWEDSENEISCTLSNFNFTTDGWVTDADGVTVLRVSGDARVTIPYKPFATDFRSTGKTIELEFATRNILNYDATLISCISGGRGFSLTAQRAYLKSEQSEISTQYKEDEHVRISFVAEKRAENRLLLIYINGIMSGVVQYPTDDDFSQVTPVNITIGSNDCTTDIYCIRVYDNNLTRYQILNNWIADTQDIDTMLERYEHNNVYDEYGNVVIAKLPTDLPYMVLSAPQLPQYKGDKKTVSGYYVDPANPLKSFSFLAAQADVQGTSSQYYPRKNYKIKFKSGFTMTATSTQVSKYAMRDDSIPTDTFTFKADVASSEGANNVELVRLYNDTVPYKTPAQEENELVRQGIDGFPMVMFWDNGSSISFIGKYNFNNDKGTEEVFGFVEGDESWEIKNNTSSRVLWKSANYNGADWLNDFEGRYPDGNTDPARLAEFAAWLVSTDQEAATGNALDAPYTDVDGIVHTNDTSAYRLAKFKTEAQNYLELDSAIYYYIFTELFLMVDSRAKNAFPSFMGSEVTE